MRVKNGLVAAAARLVACCLLGLWMSQACSAYELLEDSEISKQLEEMTSSIGDIEEQLGDLGDEVGDIVGDKTIVHSGTSGSSMKVIGRIHLDMWGFPDTTPGIDAIEGVPSPDGPQDRINFRRLRFGVGGNLPTNMRYRIEMEFAGGNNAEFRDAYFGWSELPILQTLLLGNQKRPYGLDHLNSSRYNVFLERPFVIESFNQDARRVGLQSYGLSDDLAWNWRYGVFNQRLTQDEGNYTSDHWQLEFAGRLANTIWYDEVSDGRGYAHWAISGTAANPDGQNGGDNGSTGPDQNEARFRHRPEARSASRWLDTGRIAGADHYQMLGAEAVINMGALQLVGEYQNLWLSREQGFGRDVHLHGGYMYVSYFLTGEHIPWARKSGTLGRVKPFEDFFLVNRCCGGVGHGLGAWQIAARWSYADFNDSNVLGGIGESLTVGLNWHWTANSRMQLNWINGDIRNNVFSRGVPLSGNYDIVGARFMVDF